MIIKRNKPTVYIMIGCPGSGKSTWIKNNLPGVPIISRDLIREELGYCKASEKFRGTKQQERNVTLLADSKMKTLIKQRKSFVVDDTNVNDKYLQELLKKLKGQETVGVVMKTPLETCIKRREGQVSSEVVKDLWEKSRTVDLSGINKIIEV